MPERSRERIVFVQPTPDHKLDEGLEFNPNEVSWEDLENMAAEGVIDLSDFRQDLRWVDPFLLEDIHNIFYGEDSIFDDIELDILRLKLNLNQIGYLTNGQIATRLEISESKVERLWKRIKESLSLQLGLDLPDYFGRNRNRQ